MKEEKSLIKQVRVSVIYGTKRVKVKTHLKMFLQVLLFFIVTGFRLRLWNHEAWSNRHLVDKNRWI